MPVTPTASDRNYLDILNGTASTGKTYDAVFGDNNSDLTVNDFFNMMINQLTNQDFTNPVDDTQYLAQMAQFATMQEMMDLCQYSKQNYVIDMLGREVTVSKNEIGGDVTTVTGKVEKITIENDEYKIYVNGVPYDFNKVTVINNTTSSENTQPETPEAEEL